MLQKFGFRNYHGFREGVTISFSLGANCPQSVSQGREYSPVMAIKGANASGKTTVLRGIAFLAGFAVNSFGYEPGSPIPFATYFDNPEPADLFVEFEADGVNYVYEISLGDLEVVSEVIYRKKAKKTKIIERKWNKLTFVTSEFEELKLMHLRSNVSLISTVKQYGLPGLESVINFFLGVASNVGYVGHVYEGAHNALVGEELYKDEGKRQFVAEFLRSIDVGLTDLIVHESVTRDPADPAKEKKTYIPFFVHGREGTTGDDATLSRSITWHTESSGTRALFNRLPAIKRALDQGGVLVADEFDLHLHPNILPILLDLFTDFEKNQHGAQLIFTAHDDEIMDHVGKYRCYLVNKRDNESFAYRLDEIPGDVLRNDRPISPVYRSGKIGGLPRV